MLGTVLSVMGGINTVIDLYKNVGVVVNGEGTDRLLDEMHKLREEVVQIKENIYFAPNLRGVSATTHPSRVLSDLRAACQALEPVQHAIGGKIVASRLIDTPYKMEVALKENPWNVLRDIRPFEFATQHTDPSMAPIMFVHSGIRYIGWQMRGLLPVMFNCELHDLPDGRGHQIPQRKLDRVASSKANSSLPTPRRQQHLPLPGTGKHEWFKDIEIGPELVVIPSGTFTMGSYDDPRWGKPYVVTIKKPFAIGRFEITFAEWDACVADGGSKHVPHDQWMVRGKNPARNPVINVSWNDAQEYVTWLTYKTGAAYRLPSEAEWEYCCRAGTTTTYAFGNRISKKLANFGSDGPMEVGMFPANDFGLFDMHGNVDELVEDSWDSNYYAFSGQKPTDGSAWTWGGSANRVMRGGSWYCYDRQAVSSAHRDSTGPDNRFYSIGFRVARAL